MSGLVLIDESGAMELNNVVLCFIIPPPAERPHSSWRGIVYAEKAPDKLFRGTRTLPSKIEPDIHIMKQELCDPDHIPAHIVQLTDREQYIYIEGDVCELIGVEVHMAEGHSDPYLKGGNYSAPDGKQLVLPGQSSNIITASASAVAAGSTAPIDLSNRYIVDVTFRTHPVTDQDVIDKVKTTAWNHGIV